MTPPPVRPWLALLLALAMVGVARAGPDNVATGRAIYLEGALTGGQALFAWRGNGERVLGRDAACVSCHRPSGLGGVEGNIVIPPVTGRSLFGEDERVVVRVDRRFDSSVSLPHAPYDDQSFAAAIRDGRGPEGEPMGTAMPRYALSEEQIAAVSAYLRTLSSEASPGVSNREIRIATVIAPGIDLQRRQAFVDTLTTLVAEINLNVAPSLRKRIPAEERRLNTRRRWVLDVWDLSGPRDTWAGQLDRRQMQQPVFTILSGLARDEWQPVHDFCERHRVGCWFPVVDLVPERAADSRYSLYFSRGVALEADVVAERLKATRGRVVQLIAADPVARAAAETLRNSLAARAGSTERQQVLDVEWHRGAVDSVRKAVADLDEHDHLVLWLRPAELAELAAASPAAAPAFVSATLAGEDAHGLPEAWRSRATLIQPRELPQMRAANLERFEAWRTAVGLPAFDLRMQSEVYFAARALAWTLRGMLNNLHTDYLIERAEDTLGMFETVQVQDEILASMMGGSGKRPPTAAMARDASPGSLISLAQQARLGVMLKRAGTTVYPRLSLGPGQRFASKGAYLEPLNPDESGHSVEPAWIVP